MAVSLDREQARIVREFKREARRRFQSRAERRRFVNTATQTGLVESNLHELEGGDADSRNWRQERESIYGPAWARSGGPNNTRASVRRFANEYEQFADPGERSFEIAAEIQRPAAQYRGRYREVRGQANAIRRAVALGRAPGAGGGGVPPGFDPGSPAALGMVAGATPKEALVPGSTLAAPAHSAQPVMPEGYQQPQGGGGPRLRDRLAGIDVQGMEADFSPDVGAREQRRLARERLGRGGLSANTAEGLADELSAWATQELGLKPGSRDRSPADNAAAGGAGDSDHLEGEGVGRGREGVDIPTTAEQGGWGQYRRTVRKLGGKPSPDGFSEFTVRIGGKRFRVQVIFGEKHGHGDHIHAGFRRAA